jgi:hypothetical protein
MAKFYFSAVKTIHLECEVEADTYEEAERIAEYEYITEDWDEVNADFLFEGEIIKLTPEEIAV